MAVWLILLLCTEIFSVSRALDRRSEDDVEALKKLLNVYRKFREFRTTEAPPPDAVSCFGRIQKIPKEWACEANTEPKILEGIPVDCADFPWFVSIEKGGKKKCGGLVIDSRWILTAAHCFSEIPKKRGNGQNETRCMYLDTGKTKDKYEINVCNNKHKIGIDRVRYHIFYGDEEKGDIAFVHVKNVIPNKFGTRRLCLKFFDLNQEDCTIMGYGATGREKIKPSSVLNMKSDITLRRCDSIHPRYNVNMICSGSPFYANKGDSGGPVICKDEDSNRNYVAGINKAYKSRADYQNTFNIFTGFQYGSRYLCVLLEFLNQNEQDRSCNRKNI